MSTIKIDRGFTQKMQHKESPRLASEQMPAHRPKQAQKGGRPWVILAAAGGLAALVAGVAWIVVAASSGKKATGPKMPASVERKATAVAPAPAPVPREREAVRPAEVAEATRPDMVKELVPPASPPSSAPQPSAPVRPTVREVPPGSPQGVLCEYFEGIKGHLVDDLRKAPAFPGRPDRTVQVGRFELSEKLGENYGVRVRGYVVPPKSGAYTFVLNVDDGGEFWLSTDDSPGNIRKLIGITTHTQKKWDLRPDQKSAPVELAEGKRYYLEVLLKQSTGGDYLALGWSGPVGEKVAIIEGTCLRPWVSVPSPEQAVSAALSEAAGKRKVWQDFDASRAPAQAAVAEQVKVNGGAYRFADAARALKASRSFAQCPAAQAVIDDAALRFESLAVLRDFVQSELARAPLRGVWVAFGGQADVTGASDEGVTVAPGRIVAWGKVPADQMLRLINALVPKAQGDAAKKGALLLAAAVFCKEVQGGSELAMKYRERALAANATLAASADRLLGGSSESILAQIRIRTSVEEGDKLVADAARLAERCESLLKEVESLTCGPQPGADVEYWDNALCSSIDDLRKQGITTKRAPDAVLRISEFALPTNRADHYVARVKGHLTPPASGEYVFFIASDDHSELWLSSDENPDHAVLCVKNDAAVGNRQWDKDKRKSHPVKLEKGRRYFVKALLREGERTDHLEVAWSLASDNAPRVITSEFLSSVPGQGLPDGAQEVRKQVVSELRRVQDGIAEWVKLCELDARPEDALGPAALRLADEMQRKLGQAKAKRQETDELFRQSEGKASQLRTQPNSSASTMAQSAWYRGR